ncbi:MAG: HepT-like ribonuclease domain-containing protein [Saprospiraceae bacterium]
MQEALKVWLEDIKRCIAEINEFLPASGSFHDFKNDLKTIRAIERNIEIIGEAMNRILHTEPKISISNSRKIVDTRNRIIHGYDSVSEDIIWLIAVKYLPILDVEIKALLREV